MPASDYRFLKLPRTLEDLRILRDHLESYTSDYTMQVLIRYFTVYIFMQTFMIPGTVFMSLMAGALFGVAGCPGFGDSCCNCWCIFLLFPVKDDRKAPGFFVVAR